MQSNQCPQCAHFHGMTTCEAFPDGIPPEILGGEHDHRRPFPGDKGVRFVARKRLPSDAAQDQPARPRAT